MVENKSLGQVSQNTPGPLGQTEAAGSMACGFLPSTNCRYLKATYIHSQAPQSQAPSRILDGVALAI